MRIRNNRLLRAALYVLCAIGGITGAGVVVYFWKVWGDRGLLIDATGASVQPISAQELLLLLFGVLLIISSIIYALRLHRSPR